MAHHHNDIECIACENKEEKEEIKQKIIYISISFIIFIIAIILPKNLIGLKTTLMLVSYLIAGHEVIEEAIKQLIHGLLIEENFLMTIATLGAIGIGKFSEAIAVMILYQIGELLQDMAVDKSKKNIKELMNIRPDFARIKKENSTVKVSPKDVKVNDIIIVRPGEKIPLDGKVIKGESFIDTHSITGESIPTKAKKDSIVLSGYMNQTSTLEIKVTKSEEESTATKILKLIENADEKKAHQEKFITKFAKIYTPIVIIIAILLAIIPPIILKTSFKMWIYRSLSFLVVSCPCALVISIPLSFFAGIGLCAKHGIIVKGSTYLENISKINKIIFDKTGTLTKGVFDIQEIECTNIKQEELLELVALAECHSNHPIAISIKKHYNKKIDESKIEKIEEQSGYGIIAKISGKEILVGNEKLMKKHNIIYQESQKVGTTIYIAINQKYQGMILINDTIKENIVETIKTLKNKYNISSVMLTGDKKEYADDIKNKLEIDEYYAEMLPDEKVIQMKKIKNKNSQKPIAYIGDGINDAPVLALSDIGISMGSIGSDAAIDASDIIFMEDKIEKIIPLIKISEKTLKITKQNIIFCILIKTMILILSTLGISTMWWAVFADVGVSVLAIFNSLRILKTKLQ